MKIKSLLVSSIILIIISCAAPRVTKSASNFNNTSENGMIIGTITFPKKQPRFNHYFPGFLSSTNKFKEIAISPQVSFGEKHIGELDNGLTYLFALELSEDKYNFKGVRLSTIGYGYTTSSLISEIAVPFEIKKGQITYLGNIVIDEWAKEGDTLVKFSNKFEKDIRGFKTKMPNVNFDNIVDSKTKIIYN